MWQRALYARGAHLVKKKKYQLQKKTYNMYAFCNASAYYNG